MEAHAHCRALPLYLGRAVLAGLLTEGGVVEQPGTVDNTTRMIKAYKLFTGTDGHSHVIRGTVREFDHGAVVSIHFKETAPHGVYDRHLAPERQYVITLSGELEFTMHDGSTFILRAGDVLLAQDTTGTAHKWRMLGDAQWRRAYVVLAEGSADLFEPDGTIPPAR